MLTEPTSYLRLEIPTMKSCCDEIPKSCHSPDRWVPAETLVECLRLPSVQLWPRRRRRWRRQRRWPITTETTPTPTLTTTTSTSKKTSSWRQSFFVQSENFIELNVNDPHFKNSFPTKSKKTFFLFLFTKRCFRFFCLFFFFLLLLQPVDRFLGWPESGKERKHEWMMVRGRKKKKNNFCPIFFHSIATYCDHWFQNCCLNRSPLKSSHAHKEQPGKILSNKKKDHKTFRRKLPDRRLYWWKSSPTQSIMKHQLNQ